MPLLPPGNPLGDLQLEYLFPMILILIHFQNLLNKSVPSFFQIFSNSPVKFRLYLSQISEDGIPLPTTLEGIN